MRLSGYSNVMIGPFPPPLGGISVYLYRLSRLETGFEFIDELKLTPIQWLSFLRMRGKHFIYHSPAMKRRIFFYFASLLSNNVFSIVSHGDGLEGSYRDGGPLLRLLARRTLRKARFIQVVNPKTRDFLTDELGLRGDKIIVRHAFLPPPPDDEARILASYSRETLDFAASRKPLIIANAASLVFRKGLDLYGLDMCIELMAGLRERWPDAGLLFALAQAGDEEYLRLSREKIERMGLSDRIHFMTGQKELWPLFKRASLMVRPTSSDGYGISIAEALHFGCPAVASDVCERAAGTAIFKSRDSVDFHNKVVEALNAAPR